MHIRCWGSRGSLPVSGRQFNRYGGDTTCLEIRTKNGGVIVVDAGTGIRALGTKLARARVKRFDMLFTHAHLDHIMGFPFFNPVYQKGTHITVHGGNVPLPSYREVLQGVMCAPYFPVDLASVSARLHFRERGAAPFTVSGVTVRTIFLSHPNGGLGFRFEEGKSSFVFLTDNEPAFGHPGGRSFEEYADFSRDADLLIHDAEFSENDYPANRSFGHSLFSDAVMLGLKAGAKRLGMFHLNRERTDGQVDAMTRASCRIVKRNYGRMELFAVGNTFQITL